MTLACICALIASLGCATAGGETSRTRQGGETAKVEKRGGKVVKTVDGLVKQQVNMAGVLFLRPDHAIGSYDAFLIPPVAVNYRRKSRHLSSELEEEFKTQMRQSLIDAATAADIPVVEQTGQCVMQIGMSIVDVDLKRSHSSSTLGQMTLLMEFRDSTSRQPLLRFATLNQIKNEQRSGSRNRQLRKSFDEMLERMELSGALAEAGLTGGPIREGCQGLLAQRGAAAPVSAR
jgi:hypothetical protein